jgi:single-strand DNA-binding protein
MNNNITIVGRVGAEPSTTKFPSGKTLAKFSVAVNQYGSQRETMWLEIHAWEKLAELALEQVTRGREIALMGRLQIDRYTDKKGQKVEKPVIQLTSYHLCGKRKSDDTVETEQPQPAAQRRSRRLA